MMIDSRNATPHNNCTHCIHNLQIPVMSGREKRTLVLCAVDGRDIPRFLR